MWLAQGLAAIPCLPLLPGPEAAQTQHQDFGLRSAGLGPAWMWDVGPPSVQRARQPWPQCSSSSQHLSFHQQAPSGPLNVTAYVGISPEGVAQ